MKFHTYTEKKMKLTYTQKELNSVLDEILNLMKTEGTNWVKGWSSKIASGFPVNAKTKKTYQGMNVLTLSLTAYKEGYTSNEWATYNQWKSINEDFKIKKGAVTIFFWGQKDVESEILDDSGKPKRKTVWFLKASKVFNADLVEGYQPKKVETVKKTPLQISESFNSFVKNTNADIRHLGGRAFYHTTADYIQVPNVSDFNTAEDYYGTVLHELVHWTGHKNRLERNFKSDKESYAFEELVAETGSALLMSVLGLSPRPRKDHAQYLNGWMKAIKNEPKAIFKAFSKATQALDFILNLQEKKEVA